MSERGPSRRRPVSRAQPSATPARRGQASGARGAKSNADALAELNSLLSIVEGTLLVSAEGRVLQSNESARRLLGLAEERPATLAEVTRELARADGSAVGTQSWAGTRALQGEAVRGEILSVLRDGAVTWLSVNAAPVSYRSGRGAVIMFSDITALQTLEQHNDQMIRLVSHDIRNPLTSIQLNAQLMESAVAQRGLEREKRFAEMIVSAARKLDSLIQELVDSARVRSGRLHLNLRPVVIEQLVPELLARNSRALDTARIRLVLPKERVTASADQARLERILVNVLTIAFQHASDAAEIDLRVTAHGADIRFTVAVPDRSTCRTGSAPQLGHSQADHGFGLGLYIARLLVERHGGRLWVDNPDGPMTSFHFAIPRAAPVGEPTVAGKPSVGRT